ncbi:hypothetical protein KSP39_PZI018782 [Platanthera zijinensis]|uniref:Uncharacterized protein n=1 Tax=Platanthera zijinensis TaxID=2320716 RepID=A0AAP0FYY0_9ASPA
MFSKSAYSMSPWVFAIRHIPSLWPTLHFLLISLPISTFSNFCWKSVMILCHTPPRYPKVENARLGAIHGGNFITYLAKRMGVWDNLSRMHSILTPMPIRFPNLQDLGLARRRDDEDGAIPTVVGGGAFYLDLGDSPHSPQIPLLKPHSSPVLGPSTSWDHQFGYFTCR